MKRGQARLLLPLIAIDAAAAGPAQNDDERKPNKNKRACPLFSSVQMGFNERVKSDFFKSAEGAGMSFNKEK